MDTPRAALIQSQHERRDREAQQTQRARVAQLLAVRERDLRDRLDALAHGPAAALARSFGGNDMRARLVSGVLRGLRSSRVAGFGDIRRRAVGGCHYCLFQYQRVVVIRG